MNVVWGSDCVFHDFLLSLCIITKRTLLNNINNNVNLITIIFGVYWLMLTQVTHYPLKHYTEHISASNYFTLGFISYYYCLMLLK